MGERRMRTFQLVSNVQWSLDICRKYSICVWLYLQYYINLALVILNRKVNKKIRLGGVKNPKAKRLRFYIFIIQIDNNNGIAITAPISRLDHLITNFFLLTAYNVRAARIVAELTRSSRLDIQLQLSSILLVGFRGWKML